MRVSKTTVRPRPFDFFAIQVFLVVLGIGSHADAYDVTDKLSIGAIIVSTGQCQVLGQAESASDKCRGAVAFQPQASFRPTTDDEFFIKARYSPGNGLRSSSPFSLSPWSADLRDDVKNINGRSRDYLLTAWYQRAFQVQENARLAVTGGIIDSTDYLDDNAYANDGRLQFLNSAFSNGRPLFLPSYDYGGVVELSGKPLTIRGLMMRVGRNDDGRAFTFFGGQIAYSLKTALGEGTYRLIVSGTSKDFLDPAGAELRRRTAVGVSFDQKIGEIAGVFLRLGWQDDGASVAYESAYTGGVSLFGRAWKRINDDIGIAVGYLDGGNQDIRETHVAEIYYRYVVNNILAITGDVQYMNDSRRTTRNSDGFVFGIRVAAEF